MKYITTPIYYVNDKPHIGHFYCSFISDVIARYELLFSGEVKVLTGTDEHGQKVQRSAEQKSLRPQQYADEMSYLFLRIGYDFNLLFAKSAPTHDNFFELADLNEGSKENKQNFIRTTDPRHKAFVCDMWKILVANGWIYKGKYSGFYSVQDEAFYQQEELINDKAPTGSNVLFVENDCYFFKLTKFKDFLFDFYTQNRHVIRPEGKINEVFAYLKDLERIGDLPISRATQVSSDAKRLEWGIQVPNDESHLIYVWIDALFNYMSNLQMHNPEYLREWQSLNKIHVIGKEILKFHAVYWPAFLVATQIGCENFDKGEFGDLNINEMIFQKIIVHGWWLNDGRKISKSIGNVIDPNAEIAWIISEFDVESFVAVDYFKAYLVTKFKPESDMNYSRADLIEYVNAKLVNNIGNCLNRVLSIFCKLEVGKISHSASTIEKIDALVSFRDKISACFADDNFYGIFQEIELLFGNLNQEVDSVKPWELLKRGEHDALLAFIRSAVTRQISGLVMLAPFCVNIVGEIFQAMSLTAHDALAIYRGEFAFDLRKIQTDKIRIFFPRLKRSNTAA